MERLITVLRAAHCRSTHHFFVVDALPLIRTDGGRRMASQLLKYSKRYLEGAKAPDKEFRDFRNHVVHVHDDYWGGAAASAEEWYRHLIRKIRQGRYGEAAYCAGVLSHYFTDPLMPLHTAQSERESIVHRALEWSVTKSYDTILDRYRQGEHRVVFEISERTSWLREAITQGAEISNRHYDLLIDHYDLAKGSRRPTEGLDSQSIDALAGLFGVALTGWARIIERAAEDCHVQIPHAPLSLATLVASIKMPVAWIVRRISSVTEQQAVRAIFDEFQATGTVIDHLPDEVASVRVERTRDRTQQRRQAAQAAGAFRGGLATKSSDESRVQTAEPVTLPFTAAVARERTVDVAAAESPSLAWSDNLVDAPSIGPKTATRFAAIGITTVGEFLEASPAAMEQQLKTRWIKEQTLIDWQDQARLVASVPGLCGYKAQLLVGVECRDARTLSGESAAVLHHKIDLYAGTKAGKRALRSSRVPSRQDVSQWIQAAGSTVAKRSA